MSHHPTWQDRTRAPAGGVGDAATLRAVGEACFGSAWKHELARALEVTPRTLRYWLAGSALPADMSARLLAVVERREGELARVRALIDG
jgi:transposase-like protein